MNVEHVHPIGGLADYLPLLTERQRRRYIAACQRRASGSLPMAFHPDAGQAEVRRYYAEHPTPHPDGYILFSVRDGGEQVATLAVPTAEEGADYRTANTPASCKPTIDTGMATRQVYE